MPNSQRHKRRLCYLRLFGLTGTARVTVREEPLQRAGVAANAFLCFARTGSRNEEHGDYCGRLLPTGQGMGAQITRWEETALVFFTCTGRVSLCNSISLCPFPVGGGLASHPRYLPAFTLCGVLVIVISSNPSLPPLPRHHLLTPIATCLFILLLFLTYDLSRRTSYLIPAHLTYLVLRPSY